MSPRLKIAKNLMAKSSAIFISIDDNEVGALRMLYDEIFGHQKILGFEG
jgi:adenine-specific DNA-methyltransferase